MSHPTGPEAVGTTASGPFVHLASAPVSTPNGARTVRFGFTGVAAGNLAFHVLGGPDGGGTEAEVARSRRALESAMGVAAGSTAYVRQVHSADVVDATGHAWGGAAASPGGQAEADALVSHDGMTPLAIMVADCLPVVFVDESTGATAVAHAGRRGLLDGVLQNTVARLRRSAQAQSGACSPTLRAWIGPSICGACYEVPEKLRRESVRILPEAEAVTSWGTPALDLRAGAQAVLSRLGVEVERVEACTREDQRLFSHRRAPGRGRFVGVVWTEHAPRTSPPGTRSKSAKGTAHR